MKVAIVLNSFDGREANAEMGRFYVQTCKSLQAAGHEPTIYTLADESNVEEEVPGVKVVRFAWNGAEGSNFEMLRVMPVLSWSLVRSLALYKAAIERALSDGISIIHSVKAIEALPWLADGRIPVAILAVSPQFQLMDLNFEQQFHGVDRELIRALEVTAFRMANAVAAYSETLAEIICRAGNLTQEQVRVIGCCAGEFQETTRPHEQHFPVLFCSGGIERLKGTDILIEALPTVREAFPRFKLVLAGEEPQVIGAQESFADRLRCRMRKLKLERHIEMRGIPSAEENCSLLLSSDIFIFPLLFSGLPYACLEAMAAGTAVIATTAGSIPEFIDHQRTGWLVAPDNSQALASAIIKVAGEDGLRRQIADRAKQWSTARLSSARFGQDLTAVYLQARFNWQSEATERNPAVSAAWHHFLEAYEDLASTPYLGRLLAQAYQNGAESAQLQFHAGPSRNLSLKGLLTHMFGLSASVVRGVRLGDK